jgi:hypothetical protein
LVESPPILHDIRYPPGLKEKSLEVKPARLL